MPIIKNVSRQVFELPGLKHQTLASAADGLGKLEMWMQTLEPGAAIPVHYHEREEALVVLRGAGQLSIEGKSTGFNPGTTLVVPPKVIHQLTNTGSEEMFLIAGLSETPAHVFVPRRQHDNASVVLTMLSSNTSLEPTQHFVVSFRSIYTFIFKVLGGLPLSR